MKRKERKGRGGGDLDKLSEQLRGHVIDVPR
jgi:hypothetical protein